jgi:hypothetical protein
MEPIMKMSWLFMAGICFASTASESQDPPRYLKHFIEATEKRASDEDIERDGALEAVIAKIGNAIETEDANELDELTARRKIYVALGTRSDEAGYYGRAQVKFMFEKLFRERQTRSFTYDSREIEPTSDDGAYFRAAWTYAVLDEDEVVTTSLRFRLERAGDDWRITEIRSAPR